MPVTKMSQEAKDFILAEYDVKPGAVNIKKENGEFFDEVRDKFPGLTDNQIRGTLVQAGIYTGHNPRQPAKKEGKTKADIVAELNALVGTELVSANKMTISDLEALVKRILDLNLEIVNKPDFAEDFND